MSEPTTAACTCLPSVAGGDGPEIDCPVHGDPSAVPHTRDYHQALLQVWHSGTGFMQHRYRQCGFSGAGNCCCGRHDRSPLHAE